MATGGTITPTETIRELRDIVAEIGPDTTRQCTYTKEDEEGKRFPHCIVGVFLNRHGIAADALATINGEPVESPHTASFIQEHGIVLDPVSASILQVAQEHQDSGEPWSEALSWAEAAAQDGERSYYYVLQEERDAQAAERFRDYDDIYWGEDDAYRAEEEV